VSRNRFPGSIGFDNVGMKSKPNHFMDQDSVTSIKLSKITPSPFQHRGDFNGVKIEQLAKSIKEIGLIQPVIVRPVNSHFELVCGERRFRASKLNKADTILAIVRNYDDKQARLACLTENIQRSDLTQIEEIDAVAGFIDALMDSEFKDYRSFLSKRVKSPKRRMFLANGKSPDLSRPLHRAAVLLGIIESDRKHGTKLGHKFVPKLQEGFKRLNKSIKLESFTVHDLPLLVKLEEHQDIKKAAVEKGLNKAQTKALVDCADESPEANRVVKEMINKGAEVDILDEDKTPVAEMSAKEVVEVVERKTGRDKMKSFGDLGMGVTYPDCSVTLGALHDVMERCLALSVDEIKEFVTGYALFAGHEWIKERRFTKYQKWFSKMASELEPLVGEIQKTKSQRSKKKGQK